MQGTDQFSFDLTMTDWVIERITLTEDCRSRPRPQIISVRERVGWPNGILSTKGLVCLHRNVVLVGFLDAVLELHLHGTVGERDGNGVERMVAVVAAVLLSPSLNFCRLDTI